MKTIRLFDYSWLFLIIGLVFGMQLVFVNPPWHTNDEDRHFFNAYALSKGVIGPQVKDGAIGQYLPAKLVENVSSFQGIRFSDENKIRRSVLEDLKSTENDINTEVFAKNTTSVVLPVSYFPAVVGIWIANLFNKSPIEIGWFARMATLLAYLIIVFFAIRQTPSFKPLLMAVALSPMALYQAASVSYDAMSFALLFLYFALVVKYCFSQKAVGLREIGILILVALVQRLCKDGYTVLYLVALILPWAPSGIAHGFKRQHYVLLITGLMLAAFVPSFLWSAYLNHLHIPADASANFQKDFVFNGATNFKYHLAAPMQTLGLGITNTLSQGKDWLIGAVGRFGYSYTKLPDAAAFISWLVIIAAALAEPPVFSKRMMFTFFGFGLLCAISIVYGFMIVGSPVGANLIFGLQGRYFTPIVPFLFAGAFQVRLFGKYPQLYKWAVVCSVSVLLIYSVHFIDHVFYQ